MTTVTNSIGLRGIEGYCVNVEVQFLPGMNGVSIIGLPNASTKESKERVMTALYTSDCRVPHKRIVINLSPVEQKKNSPIFDLAMAIGILKEAGVIKSDIPANTAFLGVLSLDGSVRPADGMLPAIIAAGKEGIKTLYLPPFSDVPLTCMDGIELRFVETLHEVIDSLSGRLTCPTVKTPASMNSPTDITSAFNKDFKHVLGHSQAKRALEIAAAGGHNVLMVGPPGCGKSLLAETFPSILPPLKQESQFEVLSIYQLAGIANANYQLPPFRDPHHSASATSLIGGGTNPRPGEVSLAHHGVLFLDEMAEFPKRTLDMLRQPMENGKVTISRTASTVTYPSQFLLIGAMNPCPCGYLGSRHRYCTCSPKQIRAYHNRISGPIEDRIDILLKLDTVELDKESAHDNETSQDIRSRVVEARKRQYGRFGSGIPNAKVSNEQLRTYSQLNSEQEKMMQQWASKYDWSTRVQMKMTRLARTISDLSGHETITNESIWEAVTMRRKHTVNEKSAVGR